MKFALLLLLLLSGCASPVRAVDPVEPIDHVPDPVEPIIESSSGAAVTVAMDSGQFATFAQWLGDGNTITLAKPVHIVHEAVTLDAPAGTQIDYAVGEASGTFTFAKPFPVVKAGIAKLIGGVSLQSVTINDDGTGVARTKFGGHKFTWFEDPAASTTQSTCQCGCKEPGCECLRNTAAAGAASDLPQVTLYSRDHCSGCVEWERALNSLKDKPFAVKIVKSPPAWVDVVPLLHWNDAKGNGRQQRWDNQKASGWDGSEAFVKSWSRSMK